MAKSYAVAEWLEDPVMSLTHSIAVLGAGLGAGTINAMVGSGSLITFPTLLWVGYAPVVANVSNSVGLAPGSVSGALGYRRELRGQRKRVVILGVVSAAGGVIGGVLLLTLPKRVFSDVVPALLLVACALVLLQPLLVKRAEVNPATRRSEVLLGLGIFLTAIYGGYFGAAQGVVVLGIMSIFLEDDLQRINGAKNVLVAIVNGSAALFFIGVSHVAWSAAGLVAVGAVVGGQIGARIGRRLPTELLRFIIVAVGVAAATVLLT